MSVQEPGHFLKSDFFWEGKKLNASWESCWMKMKMGGLGIAELYLYNNATQVKILLTAHDTM